MEHINHALVAKSHPQTYLMHKYWARKPHNVVAKYINYYSKKGDIVLDPFCGSGVTAIEALKHGRKAIAIDLDPMATFITRCTTMPINLEKLNKSFNRIKIAIANRIHELYKTKCPKCRSDAVLTKSAWQRKKGEKVGEEIIVKQWCKCQFCNYSGEKEITKHDQKKAREINNSKIPYWVPDNELIWNTRVNVHKGTRVTDLFTKRNLIGLSILLNEIEKESDSKIRDILRFIFTSCLEQASRLNSIDFRAGREWQTRGWTARGYWIPIGYLERNVWDCFEARFQKISRGKKETNEFAEKYKEAKKFDELLQDKTILISTQSSLDISTIPTNSVDYIFTDPPYGDSVPYLELDYMWSSWLKFTPNFNQEIIISDSPIRNKNFDEYYRMLIQAFKEIFRVLKPNRWLTLTFHSSDIEIYNSIIRAIVFAGFELEKIVYQPAVIASAKSQLHPYGSAVGDYYIRFKKPKAQRKLPLENKVDAMRFEKIVIESVKKMIAKRGEPTSYNDILKRIYIELDKHGYLLLAKPENIEKIIKKYEGKEFEFIKGQGWWFKDPSKYWLDIIPLQDRVEKVIIQTLHKNFKISFDDILQELFINFQNALTPNPSNIKEILTEYAKPTKDKKWQFLQKVVEREKEHNKMIGHLAELGLKMGFKIWIGRRERGGIYKGEPLSKLSEDGLQLPFSTEALKNIEMIDVLWIDKDQIVYEFEVENTTGITEAITRGSYITNTKTKRFIVIPEERENLLHKKINAPILKDRIIKFGWKFLFYKDLIEFCLEHKRKKTIKINEFDVLARSLKSTREKQAKIGEF